MQTKDINEIVSPDAVAHLLAFRHAVSVAMPGAVHDVVLFGSRARGDARPDSGYDVAVLVADDLAGDRRVRSRLADVAWEHVVEGNIIQAIALPVDAFSGPSGTRDELSTRIVAEGISVR